MTAEATKDQRHPASNNPNKPLIRVSSAYATSPHLNDAPVDQIERNSHPPATSGPAIRRHAARTASNTDPRKNDLRTLATSYGGGGPVSVKKTETLSNAAGR